MHAIILAAGEGTRLRPHTADKPKCLVPLAGRPLLLRQFDALAAAGIDPDQVTVVTGYRADQVVALGVTTIHNPRFHDTNMVASLMCARERFDGSDDVLVCYGDLVYEPGVVTALIDALRPSGTIPPTVAITFDRSWQQLWDLRMADPLTDAETFRLAPDGTVIELGRTPSSIDEIEGQYMGLIAIPAAMAPAIVTSYDALDPAVRYEGRDRDHMFMTSFLQHLIDHVTPVHGVAVDGGWLEVDTVEDLAVFDDLHLRGQLDRYCTLVEPRP